MIPLTYSGGQIYIPFPQFKKHYAVPPDQRENVKIT